MKKHIWQIEATELEIESILRACERENIHELGFLKIIVADIICPRCGMVLQH